MTLVIEIPDKIRPEMEQQFYGDEHYAGFNNETLVVELLKEMFEMELGQLEIE